MQEEGRQIAWGHACAPEHRPQPPAGGAAEGRRAAHRAPRFLLTLKLELLGDGLTPGKRGCPGGPARSWLCPHSRRSLACTCLLQTRSARPHQP